MTAISDFLEWWGERLASLIPLRLRNRYAVNDALVIDASTSGRLTLFHRRRGIERTLAHIRLDEAQPSSLHPALVARPRREAVVLRLAAAQVLERAVFLPVAAERDLESVLGYEMERLTPFAAGEVFWAYEVQRQIKDKLQLRLTLVPRVGFAPLIEFLSAHRRSPSLLESRSNGTMRLIRLAQQSANAERGTISRLRLLATVGVLTMLVAASPILRQSLQLGHLQSRLDLMAPQVGEVKELRFQIDGTGADAVAAETRRLGDALQALSAITEVLPDDSYLTEFTMRDRKMTLSGLGASAPKLISLLSDDARIRGPAFTAPVTRSETNRLDVFSLRAESAP